MMIAKYSEEVESPNIQINQTEEDLNIKSGPVIPGDSRILLVRWETGASRGGRLDAAPDICRSSPEYIFWELDCQHTKGKF